MDEELNEEKLGWELGGSWAQESLCPCEVGVHHPPWMYPSSPTPFWGFYGSFILYDGSLTPFQSFPLSGRWRMNWKFQASNRDSLFRVTSPAPGAHPVTSFKQKTLLWVRKLQAQSPVAGTRVKDQYTYFYITNQSAWPPLILISGHLGPLQSPGTDT